MITTRSATLSKIIEEPPSLVGELSTGAQLLLFSLRQWQIERGNVANLKCLLLPFYRQLLVEDALPMFQLLMSQIDQGVLEHLTMNCPCRQDLREDELTLIKWLEDSLTFEPDASALALFINSSQNLQSTAVDYSRTLARAGLPVNQIKKVVNIAQANRSIQ